MTKRLFSALALCVLAVTLASAQTQIEVTVTTTGPVGLAPVFGAFHDGSYDIFDVSGTSSAGLELLAELGDPSALVGSAPASASVAGFAPGGPFAPNGGTGSNTFTVSNSQTSFSLASMLLPSNDWFIGNDSAYDVSSLIGAAPGTSLNLTLSQAYDAGTEIEDFAFAPGGGLVGITTAADPPGGTATSSPISAVTGPDPFSVFANIEPQGFDTTAIDFSSGPIASVRLTVVPEPASIGMILMAGLGLLGFVRR